jgi:hypothetical protein
MTRENFENLLRSVKASDPDSVWTTSEKDLPKHLVIAVIDVNDSDPEKIRKSMDENISEFSKDSALKKHYVEMKEAFFCDLDEIPLFVNTFFDMVVKWRLENAR